ncbi:DUF5677 domain-containing protein [Brevibacillus thermoruber]|uniref:DUF5677 domain-containing protein n=1 Tax=Brevibacillus thermoruber TaxID=33942 RepID=UPI00404369F0
MKESDVIQYGRFLIQEVSKKFLREGSPYIIQEGYEYLRECITLYAKQTNLFESTLLLLESNMAEEAYILLRSMLNNYMLIEYLMNDSDGSRLKSYLLQPVKSELYYFNDLYGYAVEKGWIQEHPDRQKKISEFRQILKKQGVNEYDTRPLSILGLAKQERLLFGMYATFYRDASKYEHSDPTTLDIYKQPIDEEYSNQYVFIMDLSRTDEELKELVMKWSINVYSISFLNLAKHILNKHPQIYDDNSKQEIAKLSIIVGSYDSLFLNE